jgi:hypothetical protein
MMTHWRQVSRTWLIGAVILFPLYGIAGLGNVWATPTEGTTMSGDTSTNAVPPVGKRQGQSPKLKPSVSGDTTGQSGKSVHKRHGQSPKNKQPSKASTTPSESERHGQSPSNE